MMKPVSFFWYLYGTVALALVLTITALFFTINYVEGENDWQDFARDIQQTLLMAQVECETQNLENDCVASLVYDHGFDIESEFYNQDAELIDDWQHLNSYFTVFTFQAGFQTQIANQPNFWIRDDQAHLEEAEHQDNPLEMLFTSTAITLVLLATIALFLYWPVKRLIQWLQQLENASDALAKEDYSVILPELNVRPFSQLSKRFNRMTELIRTNLEEKRLLANAMAHEMRTPLSRARLALGLLQRKPDESMQSELLTDLDRYLDDLEKVTNNSLELVRLQNSETQLVEIALDSWLEGKLRSVQGHGTDLNWQSTLKPCKVMSDERFLTLIIDNLFSNAEQYAQQHIQVDLIDSPNGIQLIIKDDGPGIPEDQRTKAIQPFSRLDESRDRRSGGVGLGLALVSTACQRLNIKLELLDSQPGLTVVLGFPKPRS